MDMIELSNFSYHENACRTCLKSLEEENCYKEHVFHKTICDKIGSLTSFDLCRGNGLPNFICNNCIEQLNSAVEFKKQVETINSILERYLNELISKNSVSANERITSEIRTDNSLYNEELYEDCEKHIEKNESSSIKLDASDSPVSETITNEIEEETTNKPSLKKPKNIVACLTCPQTFRNATLLKNHQRVHGIVEKKFECNRCGKKYTNQYDLKVHQRKHSGVRPFSCKVCQKSFADQRCFEKHKKIHSGEKPFKCDICDKTFLHSYTLKTHLKVHSGEKPYVCAKCGHSFATSTQLQLHNRIHTQEKPYSCNLCPKTFASSSGLSNHKMTHTGQRKFICSICGKGSRTTSDLKCHLRTHTGEKPFICTYPHCDKKYRTSSQLCTHMRTHS